MCLFFVCEILAGTRIIFPVRLITVEKSLGYLLNSQRVRWLFFIALRSNLLPRLNSTGFPVIPESPEDFRIW